MRYFCTLQPTGKVTDALSVLCMVLALSKALKLWSLAGITFITMGSSMAMQRIADDKITLTIIITIHKNHYLPKILQVQVVETVYDVFGYF